MDNELKKEKQMEQIAEKVATNVFNKLSKKDQFNVPKTPFHEHNGVDAALISEDNVVLTTKLNTQFLASNPTGSPDTGDFSLSNIPNISRISFHGYAANNADGTPATKRLIITGEVIFGRCYVFTGSGTAIAVTTQTQGQPFRQCCNFMFTDTAALANTRVGTAPNFAYGIDSSPAEVASMTLTSYTNNTLYFTVNLGANYKLEGNIIIE